ncbi:MAG: NAD(P)H-dependent glycerol-3-phosphate dehydrogenase [Oscillospiraceae bacterium]
MADIIILGSGGFGASLAVMLHKYGDTVCMWSRFQEEIDEIRKYGENKKLLPGVAIDMSIELTTDLELCKDKKVIILAVPSFAVRPVAHSIKDIISPETIVVNVGKGFEESSLMRLSEVIQEELPDNDVVILSGPSHAEEIARGVPTTIVAACKNRKSAEYIQDLLMNTNLRVYVNDDIIGVELGGALKNIIAVCAGVCDGLSLGDNTKAALITRGLAEIARLGIAMGAQGETFTGLTGMGDLIVTCTSMHSRNRRCGIFIGQGLSADDATKRVGMTVEGCVAAKAAYKLSQKYNIEMPITEQLYKVITEDKDIKTALNDLMERPKRHENERIWMDRK